MANLVFLTTCNTHVNDSIGRRGSCDSDSHLAPLSGLFCIHSIYTDPVDVRGRVAISIAA